MLPKRFRLSKKEFAEVRKIGTVVSGRMMGLLIAREREEGKRKKEFPKAGIIVSKKLSNKAVIRNKLKRRLREALRAILPDLSPTVHFVVLPNRRALEATVKELADELKRLLNC